MTTHTIRTPARVQRACIALLRTALLLLGTAGSGTGALAQTATTTTLTSTTNPVLIGASSLLRATVSPSAATGTVTFKDGAATLGTASIAAGVASFTAPFTLSGSRSLSAVYAGNATYATSTSNTVTQTVTMVSGNWGLIATQGASFSVTTARVVRYGAGTAWVQKYFSGAATCSTAFFGSDPSPGTTKQCEVLATTVTSVALSSSVNPVAVGNNTVLTATVTPAAAIGSITFMDGATSLATVAVSGGKASTTRSFAAAGTRSLRAVFSGNPTYASSTSATLSQVVAVGGALPSPPLAAAPVVGLEYDAAGNTTRSTKAPGVAGFGFATQGSYDALDRLKTTTDAKLGVTQFGYDGLNRNVRVTDPRNLVTDSPRNGLGDVTQLSSPDTGVASLTYDAAGNMLTRTDSNGVLASHTYDALNRRTSTVLSKANQPSQGFVWTYDEIGANFSHGIGRLTTATFPDGSTSFRYDAQGRPTQIRQTLNPAVNVNPQAVVLTTGYGYDAAGNLSSLVYPSGRKLTLNYSAGLLNGLSLAKDAVSTAVPMITGVQHAPFGLPMRWNWVMNIGTTVHERVFDASGRFVRYPLGHLVRDVNYDAAGRITAYAHYDAVTATPASSYNQQFSYDPMDRLTQAATAQTTWAYTYDANGNRTSVALNNGTPGAYTVAGTSNRLNAVAVPPITFSYDAAGNLTSDGNFTLGYNLAGRLSTLARPDQATRSYSYDNAGQRVRKSSSQGVSATVIFVYDTSGHLLGEYDSAGRALREYVWMQDTPVAMFTPDPALGAGSASGAPLLYYVHADHLDTPRVVVDRDSFQRWRWLAEPFGTTAPETSPSGLGALTFNLRFPGQIYDSESGLHYNMQRDYAPGIGRYTQSDPIGLAGGINTYTYVNGNPISNVDPEGLMGQGSGASQSVSVPKVPSGTGPAAACYLSCKVAATPFTSAFSATTSMVGGGMCAAGGSVAGPAGAAGGYAVGRVAGTVGGFAVGQVVSGMVCSAVCGF